jgi:putative ABC transport system permease protein
VPPRSVGRLGLGEQRRPAVFIDLDLGLAALPGVVSAARVTITPVSGNVWNEAVRPSSAQNYQISMANRVGPGYFSTMGTGLLAGRDFDDRDAFHAPKVAIVNVRAQALRRA